MAFDTLDIGDGIVLLTKVQPEDAEDVFALIDSNRDYLREWFPWVDPAKGVEATLDFIERSLKQDEEKNGFQCCIRLESNIIGVMGFVKVDQINKKTEIGYWIAPSCQGRGIITKAARALTDHAFAEWGLNRVAIYAGEANTKSRAVAERLGFKFEGVLREAERVNDRYVDLAVYSMLKRDWQSG